MLSSSCLKRDREKGRIVKQQYSVAFPLGEPPAPFELKVWHKSPDYMRLVVPEDSRKHLAGLRIGERLRMHYYAMDLARPSELLDTEVVDVKENREGRAKGQYFVDLQILRSYH